MIITDHGMQFEYSLFTELGKLLGFKLPGTTARKSESAAKMAEDDPSRSQVLTPAPLGVRTVSHEEFTQNLAEFVYEENLRRFSDPMLDVRPDLNPTDLLRLLRDSGSSHHHPLTMRKTSSACLGIIYLVRTDASRRPVQPPYDGPQIVLWRGPHHFTLDVEGTPKKVSIAHMKLFFRKTNTAGGSTSGSFGSTYRAEVVTAEFQLGVECCRDRCN